MYIVLNIHLLIITILIYMLMMRRKNKWNKYKRNRNNKSNQIILCSFHYIIYIFQVPKYIIPALPTWFLNNFGKHTILPTRCLHGTKRPFFFAYICLHTCRQFREIATMDSEAHTAKGLRWVATAIGSATRSTNRAF